MNSVLYHAFIDVLYTLQLICEFLALKNDITSWRKKKSMAGMSRRTGKEHNRICSNNTLPKLWYMCLISIEDALCCGHHESPQDLNTELKLQSRENTFKCYNNFFIVELVVCFKSLVSLLKNGSSLAVGLHSGLSNVAHIPKSGKRRYFGRLWLLRGLILIKAAWCLIIKLNLNCDARV